MLENILIESKKVNVITEEEFKRKPRELTEYNPGEIIKRSNFTDLLIKSFAISRGYQSVHALYFEWIKIHYNFDYETTLSNFQKAGGWRALSEKEKIKFKQAFDRVKIHKLKYLENENEEYMVIRRDLMGLKDIINNRLGEYKTKNFNLYKELYDINNYTEFLEFLASELKLLGKN